MEGAYKTEQGNNKVNDVTTFPVPFALGEIREPLVLNTSSKTFKEILDNEWDVSSIPDLSNQEIERIYNIPSSKSKSITQFGIASGCNFTVRHKHIPDHHLHIIYYNFPEVGKVSSKVTKSSCSWSKTVDINC